MIGLAAFLIGALIGGLRARRAQGNRLDILQWATATGLFFWLLSYVFFVLAYQFGWV